MLIISKLPIITLELIVKDNGDYYDYYYQAKNENKQKLTTRKTGLHASHRTYICGFVTMNHNQMQKYSIRHLFAEFDRMRYEYGITKGGEYGFRPFAMAVMEEHKQAFQEWRANVGKL